MEKGVNVPLLRTWRLAASLVTAVIVTAALLTAEYVVMPLYAWWSAFAGPDSPENCTVGPLASATRVYWSPHRSA